MTLVHTLLRTLKPGAHADELQSPDPKIVGWIDRILTLLQYYFRTKIFGLENLPQGKALLVGNHNAGITFLEPFFLGNAWYKRTKGRDPIYFLGHDIMVAMPFLGEMLSRLGVVRASKENATALLQDDCKIMVFPGGNYEAFRPYSKRYQVDFGGKTGFVKLALRNQVNIVPVLSVGGHETFFVLWRGERLAKLTGINKLLRSESFPLFLGLPWGIGLGPIFHLPLPAKTLIEVGKPIDLSQYEPADANNRELVVEISAEVQFRLQEMMDRRAGDRRWPVLG
ncbi:MAG: acyltransferase family protein [Deltaproteobacteria bacterium]|nr:acyltransferase family protein [Deltaproteobacteria bacterium]